MKDIKLKYDEIGGLCIVAKPAMDKFLQDLGKFGLVAKKSKAKQRKPRK